MLTAIAVQVEAADKENSATDARKILEKMSVAMHSLNYDGVFVYSSGNKLDSMRIIHKVDEQGEVERLISLTGSSREVVRDRQDVTCIYSDNQTVMVNKGAPNKFLPTNFPESIARISEHYRFAMVGDDRVAGRETHIVEVMPNDEHRYVYRLWVDKETNLMLKSAIVNMQEQILETVLFTQIDVPLEISNDLMTPMNAVDYSWHTNEKSHKQTDQVESKWNVGWLPVGFSMESNNQQVFAEKQQILEHLMYSDGLATVSLFIEAVEEGEAPMSGYVAQGAVNAFTISTDQCQVTVVGELPAKTIHQIAASVSLKSTLKK